MLRKLMWDMKALPTLPTTVAELAKLLKDERAGSAAFERLVLPDPALTANLLKLANSAYFGLRRKVGSVRQAITLLGTRRVFEIAASAWFCKALPKQIPGYGINAKSFWLHCIAVAALSEQLAKEACTAPPDMVFTAGLLHDVGKLVLGSLLMSRSDDVLAEIDTSQMSFVAAEGKVLGLDHNEVGEALATEWSLPREIGWAARWHHNPADAPEEVDQELVDLVHLADNIAHSMGLGADIGELSRSLDRGSIDRLILGEEDMDRAAGESVICQIWEMSEVLPGGLSC